MTFSPSGLLATLETLVPAEATGLAVALSGGLDSACLLSALVALGAAPLRDLPVRALHVDHGLQPAASDFRESCTSLCRRLDIPLTVIAVDVERTHVSLEAAAREARYRGLAQHLGPGECLLTAQHATDQAETVLLQLLRGPGLKGLAAMPPRRVLGVGWHLRPLLDVAPRELHRFGEQAGVMHVSDPMNRDVRFDRAFLRTHVWPLLEGRWRGAASALSRTARHAAAAQELLDDLAEPVVQRLRDGNALSVTGLRALPPVHRLNALRHWIAGGAAIPSFTAPLTPPSTARLQEALRQILDAAEDHLPVIVWGDHALRRYRDRVFLTVASPPCVGMRRDWPIHAGARLELGAVGDLQLLPRRGGLDPARLPRVLNVRQRSGGETLKPHDRASTQSMQHLCQSLGVLPWMRDALPLVYVGDALIAIGDLWLDARWCVAAGAPGLTFVWHGAPIIV